MSLKGDVYGKRALDFIERLKRLDDYDAICRDVAAEIKWFGYDYVTSWSMPGPGTDQATCLLINTRPQQYIERYIERNYVIHDPVVTELRHTQDPFSWGDLRSRRNLSKSEKAIMDEAREFGSRDGFMVPVVSPSGSLAAFSVCGGEPDLSGRARVAVELIGMYSMHALKLAADKQRRKEPPRRPLTRRERQVMHYVATGRSDDEIGEILSLSTRAVTWHVENAKRKLGAYRRTYAVVLALRFGEISPVTGTAYSPPKKLQVVQSRIRPIIGRLLEGRLCMIVVLSGRDRKKNKTLFDQLFQFRYEIFFRDRGWTAPDINGPGPDEYDDDEAVYFLDLDKKERIQACMRITPTVKSSLIADRFPQLIEQDNIARAPTIYELNRHILLPALDGGDSSLATAGLLEAVFEWCFDQHLSHLQTLIGGAALPLCLEISPLITPLGLPLSLNGRREHTSCRTIIGVRWPICSQLLQDVCSYKRRASCRIIIQTNNVKH